MSGKESNEGSNGNQNEPQNEEDSDAGNMGFESRDHDNRPLSLTPVLAPEEYLGEKL